MYMYLRLHSMHEMRDWCFSNALGHINIYIYIYIYIYLYIYIFIFWNSFLQSFQAKARDRLELDRCILYLTII
jgi:hypothetical protein